MGRNYAGPRTQRIGLIVGTNGKALPGGNGKGLEGSLAKQSAQEIKPRKVSRQARSISKSGPAELGEPFYSRQQLGTFHETFVTRMRDAISAGTENAVERTVKSPGTKNPRPYLADRGVLP